MQLDRIKLKIIQILKQYIMNIMSWAQHIDLYWKQWDFNLKTPWLKVWQLLWVLWSENKKLTYHFVTKVNNDTEKIYQKYQICTKFTDTQPHESITETGLLKLGKGNSWCIWIERYLCYLLKCCRFGGFIFLRNMVWK